VFTHFDLQKNSGGQLKGNGELARSNENCNEVASAPVEGNAKRRHKFVIEKVSDQRPAVSASAVDIRLYTLMGSICSICNHRRDDGTRTNVCAASDQRGTTAYADEQQDHVHHRDTE